MTWYVHMGQYELVELEGECFILDTEGYTVTRINEMGRFCWELLATPQTSDRMVYAILEQFDGAEEAQVREDVSRYLEELQHCGLLELRDEA